MVIITFIKKQLKQNIATEGFTLLEVVVAVVILGLAYVAILQNFSFSSRNIARLQDSRTAIFENALAFEKQLQNEDDNEEQNTGEVFLKGKKFNLVIVSSDDGSLTSLELVNR